MWRFETDDAGAVETWLLGAGAALGAAIEPSGGTEEHDVFADTEARAFERAGYALRMRKNGSRIEAVLLPLHPGGEESEPLPLASGDAEDLKRSPDPLGERIRAVAGLRAIRPVLEGTTRRRLFALRLKGRRCGELEIEEITAQRPGGKIASAFARVRLEGIEPDDPALAKFAAALENGCGLARAGGTVFSSALHRLGVAPPPPPVPGPFTAEPGDSVRALAYAVLRRHLASLLKNEPGTRLGEDPEALHDMRVASRRLRAALALFGEVLPVRAHVFRRRLGRIGRALGEVRDLDVQLEQLEEFLREAPASERLAMQAYLATVVQRRGRARRRMLRVLDSRGYVRLVESFRTFVEREPPSRPPAARRPALAAAPDLILRSYRKATRIGDRLTPASPAAEWHALRIALKRLRYALEFHASLYGPDASAVIEALVALQDLLGLHQDAQVAMAHLEDMCGPRGRRLARGAAFAMGRVAQRYAERAEDLRAAFPKLYRSVRGKRWRRLREAMKRARPHL